jgi:hypothetical protein
MRKLILGIVAVFCVQIMFQVFTDVDLSDAGRRARLEQGQLVDPVSGGYSVDVAEMPRDEEMPVADIETAGNRPRFAVLKRAVAPRLEIASVSYSRPAPRRVNTAALVAMAERPATPDVFAPQMITYPAYLSAKESTRTEKRSFFAKALPVIKKPYDLLKAVGSKLK